MAKLYSTDISVNCFGPWLLLQEAKIPFILDGIDLMKGEQEKLKPINPLQCVPTFTDDTGLTSWESNAIMRHICRRYKLSQWIPSDPEGHARQDVALDWRQTVFYRHVSGLAYPILFGKQGEAVESKAELKKLIRDDFELIIDTFLGRGQRPFIGGEQPGLADLTIAPAFKLLSVVPALEFPRAILDYLARFERAVPSFLPTCDKALHAFLIEKGGAANYSKQGAGSTPLTDKLGDAWEATKQKASELKEKAADTMESLKPGNKDEGTYKDEIRQEAAAMQGSRPCCGATSSCTCKMQGCTKVGCECPGAPARNVNVLGNNKGTMAI